VALVEGFSLHADTWVHANDREGLARLARYGARGPLASSRVTLREDGVVEYRMKRTAAHGAGLLVLTPGAFLRRLAALVPPPKMHLVHYHGAFAPHARVRKALVSLVPRPDVPSETVSSPPPARPPAPQRELLALPPSARPRPPRLDWAGLLRRTFALDVLTCRRCGGRRRVEAVITDRDTARALLLAMGLSAEAPPTGPPPRPRQLALPL
jgi:hypothetical protein